MEVALTHCCRRHGGEGTKWGGVARHRPHGLAATGGLLLHGGDPHHWGQRPGNMPVVNIAHLSRSLLQK